MRKELHALRKLSQSVEAVEGELADLHAAITEGNPLSGVMIDGLWMTLENFETARDRCIKTLRELADQGGGKSLPCR